MKPAGCARTTYWIWHAAGDDTTAAGGSPPLLVQPATASSATAETASRVSHRAGRRLRRPTSRASPAMVEVSRGNLNKT
ncbi:hypothetical protein GCM10023322_15480 [Rugosimonospora acidiphila]|uniref:Uncharacterized protein n=1 Tax=Rugosimonospora acidiphila TaxID=556531 RepID=A0ABP9RP90_9ACTN